MSASFPERRRTPGPSVERSGLRARYRLFSPAVGRVARRLDRVFDALDGTSYLGEAERTDFLYFRSLLDDSLLRMDRKAREGRLRALDLRGFPQDLRYPGLSARLGIFIGSFDPFQMTHLAMALRFLASDASEADALFVVPEGSADPRKPLKTDYRFRLEILKRQISGIFEPFVLPLDLGERADTIEIVSRLIRLHPGASLRLTHLLGSDVLPMAVSLLPDDLEAWGKVAQASRVDLDFSIHVARRDRSSALRPYAEAVRRLGVRMVIDRDPIGTPSSTAFRREGAITLVLPTEAILSRLELLFRYGMYRSWSPGREGYPPLGGAEYEI
jgi:nicotinic acid mononucleotide adenylyltransferase